MKKTAAILFILLSAALPAVAGGGVPFTGGATEMTQMANNSELGAILGKEIEQIAKQVEIIQNQMLQYREMLKQGMTLPESVWVSAKQDLMRLKNSVRMTSGLYSALGNLDQVFRQSNPGIVSRSKRGMTYEEWYSGQSEAYRNSIAATLKGIDVSSTQMEQDSNVLARLHMQSRSAVGQMQAIQVGNDIAAETVQQLMKLQAAMNRQTMLIAAYLAAEQDKKDSDKADNEEYSREIKEILRQWEAEPKKGY